MLLVETMPPGTWSEGEMYVQYEHVIDPFFKACFEGKMDVIDRLIDKFPINAIDGINNALIMVCFSNAPNTIDIARILIDRGIDVDYCTKYGSNALEFLLSDDIFRKQLATLVLYNSKLGVNHLGNYGYNYLIHCKTLESVMFLVENGININHAYASGDKLYTYIDMIFENEPEDKPVEDKPVEDKPVEDTEIVQYLTSVGGKRYQDL